MPNQSCNNLPFKLFSLVRESQFEEMRFFSSEFYIKDSIDNIYPRKWRDCDIRLSKKCDVVRVIIDVVIIKYNYITILNEKKKFVIRLPKIVM
jgi:hypothetical protein